jgi:hypothetical protein
MALPDHATDCAAELLRILFIRLQILALKPPVSHHYNEFRWLLQASVVPATETHQNHYFAHPKQCLN